MNPFYTTEVLGLDCPHLEEWVVASFTWRRSEYNSLCWKYFDVQLKKDVNKYKKGDTFKEVKIVFCARLIWFDGHSVPLHSPLFELKHSLRSEAENSGQLHDQSLHNEPHEIKEC